MLEMPRESKGLEIRMMMLALEMAREAGMNGEVPVGAVLADSQGRVLASAGNNCIAANDPTGHAEMLVLRQAASNIGNYRLQGTTLFVTLEPCPMCAAAMVHARIERLVFGAIDSKAGGVVSKYRIGTDEQLNHGFSITAGLLADDCGRLLKKFFQNKRK